MKKAKGTVFIEHIKAHLLPEQDVICTLCGRTVDQVYEKWRREKLNEHTAA